MAHEIHPDILHPEYFKEPFGHAPLQRLSAALADRQVYPEHELPPLVVAVQSYNHSPQQITALHSDLEAQRYPADKIFPILLSTHNESATEDTARSHGMEVVPVEAKSSLRADYLNTAVEVATSQGIDVIYTTVGHAALSSKRVLQTASLYDAYQGTMAYGVGLPKGGTWSERAGAVLLGAAGQLKKREFITEDQKGIMASDCSVISAEIMKETGGYDTAYGLGGADGEKTRKLQESHYIRITRDPLLSAHVTKGFGPIRSLRQLLLWNSLDKPHDFDAQKFAGWHPHGGL